MPIVSRVRRFARPGDGVCPAGKAANASRFAVTALIAALAAVSTAATAHAQTTYSFMSYDGTDLNYTGGGVAGVANFVYTPDTSTSGQGSATENGVTMTFTYDSFYATEDGGPDPANLLGNYAYESNGSGNNTITLSGLPVNSTYTLYLYGINGDFHNRGTEFSFTDGLGDLSSASTNNTDDTSFAIGDNFVELTGNTGSSGTITGTYIGVASTSSPTNREGDFNGLQITVNAASAPEPSSALLLLPASLSLLGAAGVRRRRSRGA